MEQGSSIVRKAYTVFLMGVGSAGAHLGTSLMPFLVAALMDAVDMNAAQASLYGSLLIGGYAVSMLLISKRVQHMSPTTLALIGTVISSIANIAVFLGVSGVVCHLMGLMAGVGYGILYSGTIATVSRTAWREAALSLGTGVALLLIVITMALVQVVRPMAGPLGPFLLIGLFLGGSGVIFLFAGGGSQKAADTPTIEKKFVALDKPLFCPRNVVLLSAWCLFSIASASTWGFAERVGRSIGMDADTIPTILSFGTLVSILGTVIAGLTIYLLYRRTALMLGVLLNGLGAGLIALAWDVPVYVFAVMLYWSAHMFGYVYMLSSASVLDNSGTLATFGSGAERLAYSVGTLLSGVIVQFGGFAAIGIWAFGVTIVVTILLMLPILSELKSMPERARLAKAKAGDTKLETPA